MNNQEIIEWLEAKSESAEKQGLKVSATILAETANELRAEIKRRNAANITELDRKQYSWARVE